MIPILAYHKIENRFDFGITTRQPDDFENDMKLLKENGYITRTFRDGIEDIPENEKSVIITFDDGYASFYKSALPVLQRMALRAVVFMPTAFVGAANSWDVQWGGLRFEHMNRKQLREAHRAGMEIGSHLISHTYSGWLKGERLEAEMLGSKQQLEAWLDAEVISLSYPFGKYEDRAVRMAARYYRYAVGLSPIGAPSRLFLPRISVYRMDSSRMVLKKIERARRGRFSVRDRMIQWGAWASIYRQRLNKPYRMERRADARAELG
ncbi:MAG: polysaccharide deacetylase family protein [Calditrichaeota bacterium]|nr:MAG: polysaccharide deacetylase family protein [Calditrichota bacterium]